MLYQGNLLSKTLVIGIIILFIIVAVAPVTSKVPESAYNEEKCDIKADNNIIFKIFGGSNSPPYVPAPNLPYPIPIDVNLSWHGGDPDSEDSVTYDVFFGEWMSGEEPPLIATVGPYPANQKTIWYDLSGVLKFNTKYFWRIVAYDNHDANTSSDMWIFTTEPNYPPNPAHDPIPPNGASNVPGDAILCWKGRDPNSGDTLTYDVYFCICYPPVQVSKNQTETCYDPYGVYDMPLFEEYYWRIVTWDSDGLSSSSPLWSFTTGINHEPYTPVIDGPTRGRPGITYYYNFTIDDEDGHFLMLLIDWGDGTSTDWIGPFEPGETITVGYIWEERGIFGIRAIAEDLWGEPVEGTLVVTIPKNKPFVYQLNLFDWLFERFPLLEVFLRAMNLLR